MGNQQSSLEELQEGEDTLHMQLVPREDDHVFSMNGYDKHITDFMDNAVKLIKSSNVADLKSHLEVINSSGYMEDTLTCKDQYGWTLLHYATDQDSFGIFNLVVQYVADSTMREALNVLTRKDKLCPLHVAVKQQRVAYIQCLLELQDTQLDITDGAGNTPLHYACLNSNVEIVKALATAGCDFIIKNNNGDYPLHLAAYGQCYQIFTMLQQQGTLTSLCQSHPDFWCLQDGKGNTLLHVAVDKEQEKTVELILTFHPDVNLSNNVGVSPLHIAAIRGNITIAKQIVQRAQDSFDDQAAFVSFINTKTRPHGQTPLYLAAKHDHPDMVNYLLDLDPAVETECTTIYGFTPLLVAVRYTNLQCVRTLLQRNANPFAKDNKRKLSALFWAVEVQDPQILKEIIEHSEDKGLAHELWKERDPSDNTPHHLAAKKANLTLLEILKQHNNSCLEQINKDGSTPFHVAVKEGNIEMVNFIISSSPSSTHSLDGKGSNGLHIAADMGHQDIVESLLTLHDFGRMVCAQNDSGLTPVHLAAIAGHETVLTFLLEHSPAHTIEILDNDNSTALYVACELNKQESVEVLLAHGALVTYTYGESKKKKSCLTAAILKQSSAAVNTILKSPFWEQALQYCDECSETPIRMLIKKMPNQAKLIYNKCIQKTRISNCKNGSYYYEHTYNYDYLEDFQDLYPDEGPRHYHQRHVQVQLSKNFEGGDSFATNYMYDDTLSVNTPRRQTTLHRLKGSISQNLTSDCSFSHVAQPCPLWKPWGPAKYRYKNHPLYLMIKHKRTLLLKHPLVASFIHYKWNLFGRFVYYPNILLYTFLMLLLTVYMHLHFEFSKTQASLNNLTISDCSVDSTFDDLEPGLVRKKLELIVIAVLIIANCFVRIAIEVMQLIRHKCSYFYSLVNFMEVFLYVATIVFVADFSFDCLPSWRWQLGAACIFLSWLNFILFLSQQPTLGIYVVMFQHIMKTFLKMVPMTTLLILAFGQPFYMLLNPSSTARDSETQPFANFSYSLLKTLTMTVGEFDETDHIFYSVPNIVTYDVVTYILWIIFLAVMPILLQNMLVGLAVDDIKGVQDKAVLKKDALQVEFVLDVMSTLPKPIIRWFNSRKYTQSVGLNFCSKFVKWLSGSAWNYSNTYKTEENHSLEIKLNSVKETVDNVEYRLHLLGEQNVKLEKMIMQLSQHETSRAMKVQKSIDFY